MQSSIWIIELLGCNIVVDKFVLLSVEVYCLKVRINLLKFFTAYKHLSFFLFSPMWNFSPILPFKSKRDSSLLLFVLNGAGLWATHTLFFFLFWYQLDSCTCTYPIRVWHSSELVRVLKCGGTWSKRSSRIWIISFHFPLHLFPSYLSLLIPLSFHYKMIL